MLTPHYPSLPRASAFLLAAGAFGASCGTSHTLMDYGAASAGAAGTGAHTGTGAHATSTGTHTGAGGSAGTAGGSGTGGLPPGSCHGQSDCPSGYYCGALVLPPYCGGMCDNGGNGDCMTDADCADAGPAFICGLPCGCPHGGAQPQNHCTAGCTTDADCGPSMACDATHRCTAAACGGAGDCTANFTCTSMLCAAKPCTSDADCAGYCVDGACSPVIGSCAAEVP